MGTGRRTWSPAGAVAAAALLAVGAHATTARAAGAQATGGVVEGAAPGTSAVLDGPDAAAVRDREVAFARTMADRDFEAFLTFVSPEAIFFAGERALRGRDAVADAWRPFFEGAEAPFSWVPDLVQVLESGTLALSSGPVTAASGAAAGRFNSIWRKDPDGQWRVIFDKGSN